MRIFPSEIGLGGAENKHHDEGQGIKKNDNPGKAQADTIPIHNLLKVILNDPTDDLHAR